MLASDANVVAPSSFSDFGMSIVRPLFFLDRVFFLFELFLTVTFELLIESSSSALASDSLTSFGG